MDGAGGDRVDAHAAWAVLRGPALGQRRQGGLGRAIDGSAGQPDPAGYGADVDDAARALLCNSRGECAHEQVRRPDVGGEYRIEVLRGRLLGWSEHRLARVVDQDVDLAGLFSESLDLGRVTEVGVNEPRPAACCFDLPDYGVAAAGVAPDDDHTHTVAGKLLVDLLAQAASCARHQLDHVLRASGLR